MTFYVLWTIISSSPNLFPTNWPNMSPQCSPSVFCSPWLTHPTCWWFDRRPLPGTNHSHATCKDQFPCSGTVHKLCQRMLMQLCLPSHSIRFWPMSTNIFTSVQLGPCTLCGSETCDCEETGVDRPVFDLPMPWGTPLAAAVIKCVWFWSSTNSDGKLRCN